ncbi:MAG: hypothetical protein E7557_07235 [Ruminococcaceae bacterium]|nr:hypothetical protein [Oscillospiraceae bacterium]
MKLKVKEIATFAMLGALIFAFKKVMEFAPNVHLVGVFIVAITVVYRKKALYPIYIYVFLDGLFGGFSTWWVPYLYIWALLWGAVMLLPKNIKPKFQPIIYMTICALHGFLYGILYAPAQALFFNLDFNSTIAWIVAGLPYDLIHGVSNFICGLLIVPIIAVLKKVNKI